MRPDIDSYFMAIAEVVATRGTCARRKVGVVLTDYKRHIVATGYNGTASGLAHCTECPCPGVQYPSGSGLDDCEALHAEQNALCQCRDVHLLDVAYVTVSPCVTCTKLLLGTSCSKIVFKTPYPDNNKSRLLWEKAGREWVQWQNTANQS